ncbi:MAG: FkbM family methyltransferase [Verrucomicrobia bacterium]|jgi:FkbM family methyltransferase|nr:FkbM family methyltransferase [Verrucomicrobiota bacterium]MBT7067829.1 FkbM family methyltransferase [Verrucomicrobiota bacterium]MBT7700287.1 FkbM family methyltransferase [Verrucomicrobiota bacterium]
MKLFVQELLLKTYALIVRTGVLETRAGRRLFAGAYNLYKLLLEACEIRFLRAYVKPGEVVVDVGANVGFFTRRFAQWVSDGGFVIAIEPEETNFRNLLRNLDRYHLAAAVRPFQGVAAEAPGTLKLEINPIHPADHKIGAEGVDVTAYTVDGLVRQEGVSRVSLMKIDVQGAEERVLRGAGEMIARDHPVIFIEMDDTGLRKMDSSAQRVIDLLTEANYEIRHFSKAGKPELISIETALGLCADGRYTDLLFVPVVA